ncbi:hypothetical protein KAI04_03970 [Candidatus Pacearchaeota archaeon]|nr:hypothetical protein [Candidatus Pacearchaeota archaeon]
MQKNILIYDIETETNGNLKDIEQHKLKYFGAYSYKNNKYYFLTDKKEIQLLIKNHKILVGFNTKNYDNPILIRGGINLDFKVIIDLYKIIEKRADLIKFKESFLSYHLKSYSLDTIIKTLNLTNETKKEIDYKLFDIKNPTNEQLEIMEEYTIRDIELTKRLFEYIYEQFDNWKFHLEESDQKKLKHLSCAPSVYAYKVLAKRCGFKEEYRNVEERTYQGDGGYVSYPAIEKLTGNIYCLDFASLYPHIMIQCNLYGRNKEGKGWHGNNKFNIVGFYDTNEMHPVSKVLLEIYNERKELKENNDPREYGLKITLNTCYGLLRNPVFKSVYDNIAGTDICLIAQQWVKMAIKRFNENGYHVVYTDTDSIYFEDVFDDEKRLLDLKNELILEIKNNVPFPQETFDMGIDYKISMLHFFKGGHKKDDDELTEEDIKNKELGLMKKNYIFVYKDKKTNTEKMMIKNLGIVKRNNTDLSKKIFWKNMVPKIIENKECKFPPHEIYKWIKEYLEEDISYIAKRISVGNLKHYKSKSAIQIQAYNYKPQTSDDILGEGIHYFIPNFKIGIGKGVVKYCTIDEFNKLLAISDIYTDIVVRELRYFNQCYIKPTHKKIKEVSYEDTLIQKALW